MRSAAFFILPFCLLALRVTPRASIFRHIIKPRILVTTIGVLLAGISLHAADFTLDVTPGDGTAITPGDGTWDNNAGNTIWNDAGTNKAWAAANRAVFGGADGTYNI